MKLSTSGLAWASLSFVHVWHHEVRGADHAQRALRFKAMLRQVLGYFDIRTSNILTDRLVHEAVQMKRREMESTTVAEIDSPLLARKARLEIFEFF